MRPWSQTMVSEGARPWGSGRSEFADWRMAQKLQNGKSPNLQSLSQPKFYSENAPNFPRILKARFGGSGFLESHSRKTKLARTGLNFCAGLWQNGVFADFCSSCRLFFRRFCRRIFSPHFVGNSAQKNPPGESPAKPFNMYITKIPDTSSQRDRANKSMRLSAELAKAALCPQQTRGSFRKGVRVPIYWC